MFYSNCYSILGRNQDVRAACVESVARALPSILEQAGASFVAVQGTSGVCMAMLLLDRLPEVPFVMVRKDGESAHGYPVEMLTPGTVIAGDGYVILDDLVSSGKTVQRIVSGIYKLAPSLSPHGVLTYAGAMQRGVASVRYAGKYDVVKVLIGTEHNDAVAEQRVSTIDIPVHSLGYY